MAGAEKICEFSGNYAGWPMYKHKRNSIQVEPQYRKAFRKAEHELVIQFTGLRWVWNYGAYTDYDPEIWEGFYTNGGIKKEYNYCLIIKDKALHGVVDGLYFNHTRDLTATKRKLKRLLKVKKLTIKILPPEPDFYEYIFTNYN